MADSSGDQQVLCAVNSREDLHYNLREWPTGSESVDQELHKVIDRAFDLEAAGNEFAEAVEQGIVRLGWHRSDYAPLFRNALDKFRRATLPVADLKGNKGG